MAKTSRQILREKQRTLKPDTITGDFYLFGKPSWEIGRLENGDLNPELITDISNMGDILRQRLKKSARALTKLSASGWQGLGGLYDFQIWKETTREQAIRDLSEAKIDPESINLQEVATDKDYGWVEIGEEFTIPKQAATEINSIPDDDLTKMKTQLQSMEKALKKQRKRLKGEKKHTKVAEAREERLVKNNDILTNALRIVSTFLEETLAQPNIRRLD